MSPPNCSQVTWGSRCDVVGNCASGPITSGCYKDGSGCNECHRASLVNQEKMTKELKKDETVGFIIPELGFLVCQAGVRGLVAGDIIQSINGMPISAKMFEEIEASRPDTSTLTFYRAGDMTTRTVVITRSR